MQGVSQQILHKMEKKNPEKVKRNSALWLNRGNNRDKKKRYQKGLSTEIKTGYTAKSRYGIDRKKIGEMLRSQKGLCAICRQKETSKIPKNGSPKSLGVDHCHSTGKIRGLLCFRCNSMIGLARDSVPRLRAAIQYLEKSK